MKFADTHRIPPEEARTEPCPTCQAGPGDPCTYEHDLFRPGPAKELVHRRGDPLTSGVHNARTGIIKARRMEQYRQERDSRPRPVRTKRRRGQLDARVAAAALAGKTARQIAADERASLPVVLGILRDQGIIPVDG